ncbi:4-alpha-glucanotransferase [Saccharothrix sp.]|uniref:4-alpha-glucanotransferase n=1 Tax=Saccharothrix sp. TaxID=1873460 RepID=UPI0028110B06|nr:4-alpha-glucanotransferase [Saccharothrix sp.]
MDDQLAALADAHGVATWYEDADQKRADVDPDVVVAVLAELGVDASTPEAVRRALAAPRPAPKTIVLREGDVLTEPGVLALEDGSTLDLPATPPLGYHHLGDRTVIVAPRALPPVPKTWGWMLQLYAMRSDESWGMGDFADLATIARRSATELGAGVLLVNPVQAVSPTVPVERSPYSPSSRRFANPLYLRIADTDAYQRADDETRRRVDALRPDNDTDLIDYDAVWTAKKAALELLWESRLSHPDATMSPGGAPTGVSYPSGTMSPGGASAGMSYPRGTMETGAGGHGQAEPGGRPAGTAGHAATAANHPLAATNRAATAADWAGAAADPAGAAANPAGVGANRAAAAANPADAGANPADAGANPAGVRAGLPSEVAGLAGEGGGEGGDHAAHAGGWVEPPGGAADLPSGAAGLSGEAAGLLSGEVDQSAGEGGRSGAGDRELWDFARFCALAEKHGPDWRTWPEQDRDPATAQADPDRVAFHAWLQHLCEAQLTRAREAANAMAVGIVHDLPVGVHPGGADTWAVRDAFAPDVRVGAPPDAFSQLGQDWNLPPWRPDRLAEQGYEPFRAVLRSVLKHGDGIRIDHVAGLWRLWWIPPGEPPKRGTYVRYDENAMLAVLTLEAHRANAVVVGEDLGTVEPKVTEQLHAHGMLSSAVLWFQRDYKKPGHPLKPPRTWTETAMASISTHDLPTAAGFLQAEHVRVRAELGQFAGDVEREYRSAATERAELEELLKTEGVPADDLVTALHALLAKAPSLLLLTSPQDALGDTRQPNLPGTVDQYPNWRIPLPVRVGGLFTDARVLRVAEVLRR